LSWLTDNPWLAWLGIALVLAAVEAMTVDFVFVMLAGGALAAALVAGAGAGLTAQVVTAVVVAALLLFIVRPIVKRHFMDGAEDHGIGASSLVGREARVIETVTSTDGRVKLGGETWSARTAEGAQPCRPGTAVTVLAIHGATAIVESAAPLPRDPAASA
jgi:membrane protein implicated in regulation of membrane protease activity